MTLLRCALLGLCLLACGSPPPKPVEPPVGAGTRSAVPPPPPQPVAAKPVAVTIVFQGWEMWIGNDQLTDISENEHYLGVLRPLQENWARLQLTGFPAGSQAALVTYAEGATVRHPMAPIEKLTAAAFGEQKDYVGTIDRDLVAGIKLGLDELAKTKDHRRILVVIGDGTDTTPHKAKVELAALAKRAAAENVEMVSLVYKGALSTPDIPLREFDPGALVVNSVEGITDQLGWLFARVKQPPVVAKPGGGKGLVLALLINGSEIWIGNDDFTPANDPSRYPGALNAIRTALEVSMKGFPAGSQAMVMTYESKARVRAPAMPIESFDVQRALGVQRDYYSAIGSELVSGVTFAFTELLKLDGARRVLVIVGDGTDTNNEAAKTQLRALAKRAAEHKIEVYAVVFKGELSDETTVVNVLDPNAQTAASTNELTAKLVEVLTRLRKK